MNTAQARLSLFGLALAGTLTALPMPAPAQVQDRIIDVYGDESCPSNNGQEIVVCRRHPAGDKYRIPKELRESEAAPQALGGNAAFAVQSTGATGIQVQGCNAIGANTNAGCTKKQLDAWKAEQRAQKAQEQSIP
ncbi:hypothetical protein [Sphingomonas morindae]|uniref:Uncharacterized protein n=1 Tax=Sphingomonas morindae TaxID=1541170 RepID=A0ABY4X589_9SPHN|nr:hypothetical protein [Sphingomonas morindae]USI72052.1 hypothetical protein LHA26_12135 [Sphingomonas morindae]